ncbi:MAG: hypothetical protein LBS36_03515 [Oscillospiraceae bacterium]|jgi:hypothetical protein|nr:hypothetical protein [Oscillospiraceae bacterium]
MNDFSSFIEKKKEELQSRFPLPREFALADKEIANGILERVRRENTTFLELSVTELNYAYQMAELCNMREYASLKNAFRGRMTQMLFEIGWIYCQQHPENQLVISLFLLACEWIKLNKPVFYEKTLIALAGESWVDIYQKATELMQAESLSMEDFCRKYGVDLYTPFYDRLQLLYLCGCDKEVLLAHEQVIASLVESAELERLRPLVRNFVAKVTYTEMPQRINDAIFDRLVREGGDETLGLSQLLLEQIRSQHYVGILESFVNPDAGKMQLYACMAGMIRQVELLPDSFCRIDIGNYVVLDNSEWVAHAYAYPPAMFERLMEGWKSENYPPDYWPGMKATEIVSAHDVILGLQKSNVIQLGFESFDRLYARDFLCVTRYANSK